ncbi:MAG TPA: YaaR family protein [Bacilli bacterium]
MKIDPRWRPIGNGLRRHDTISGQPVRQKTFSDMMADQDERNREDRLRGLLKDIAEQGERLGKTMTVRELRIYKQLVKQYLEETVRRGVGLKETKGWDRRGRGKRYKLIEEIDRKLLEMAEDLLQSEQGRITILDHVGEIRGLLINLLF